MALTRRFLNALGIEAEKVDQIIEGHSEAVESLKAQRDEAEAKAEALRTESEKVPNLEKQIEELKAADKGDEWKAKYDELKARYDELQESYGALKGEKESLGSEYESYKQQVEADKANAEKLSLYKGLLREIGLDEERVELAAGVKKLDELTVVDGKLDGYDELKASEATTWRPFIPQPQGVKGQSVPTPPKAEPTGEQPNPRAVQIAKERHEKLHGKSEE